MELHIAHHGVELRRLPTLGIENPQQGFLGASGNRVSHIDREYGDTALLQCTECALRIA